MLRDELRGCKSLLQKQVIIVTLCDPGIFYSRMVAEGMGGSSILLGGGMVEDLLFPNTTSNFQDKTSIRGEFSGLDPCFLLSAQLWFPKRIGTPKDTTLRMTYGHTCL